MKILIFDTIELNGFSQDVMIRNDELVFFIDYIHHNKVTTVI